MAPFKIIALNQINESDIFKHEITEDEWRNDALDKAWKKEDIKDDR